MLIGQSKKYVCIALADFMLACFVGIIECMPPIYECIETYYRKSIKYVAQIFSGRKVECAKLLEINFYLSEV